MDHVISLVYHVLASEYQLDIVPLCGPDLQDVLPDSAPSELPPSPTRRDHVMVLPNVGETKRVGITGNSTGPLQPMRCLLRIDVCQECVVKIEIVPPNRFLDDETIHMNLFPIEVTAESSHSLVKGESLNEQAGNNQTALGYIESPRYPEMYPSTIIKRYTLVNENPNGFVRLMFDDFQIHHQSQLQIFEEDNTELYDSKTEDNRRPPAIQSKGSTLHIEFRARDFSHKVGFRAKYEFTNDHEWVEKPNSRDCDAFLNNYGGDISMSSHVDLINSYVDCIWIIERLPYAARTFDRIYLKVDEFQLKGMSMRLEIREGETSTSDRLLLLMGTQTREELDHKQPR
ncbi:hypothetical protein WR25_18868 [Diploscapter pachys]|uniref:CUB domain-containing protein n=1 Tax=Diploscapter pachys TaxID=2018661 RepID=A0A2A2KQ75_9BILA|nr:hypothetical protein WR25_18868 [Diploscapter pachys]